MKKTAVSVGGRVAALLITLTAIAGLAGCGQKGPLTLPAKPATAAASASAPASAPIVAPKP
jgi:predicted small lipoprotein YifL